MFANCIWHLACTVITQCYFVVSLSEPVKEQKMHLLESLRNSDHIPTKVHFCSQNLMENRTKPVSTWEHDSFHLSIWNQAKKNLSSISSFVSQKWSMGIKLGNFSPRKKSEPFILTRVTVIHPNICQYFFSPPDLIFKSNASIIQHGT